MREELDPSLASVVENSKSVYLFYTNDLDRIRLFMEGMEIPEQDYEIRDPGEISWQLESGFYVIYKIGLN